MSEEEVEQSVAGSLMSHLVELRDRVVRMVVAVLVIFLCLFYWANDIYVFLAEPLTRHLPEGANMIAIDVASPFLTPFSVGPEIVNISTDIGRYLDFVLALFFGFGLAFEVPIATIILVAIGITTPKKLADKRPYIIVAAFIIGMLLTPPDVISQVLLALPMWVLFEAGLIASRMIFSDREFDDDDDDDEADEEEDDLKPSSATAAATPKDSEPLTDEEMEAELDQAEADEKRNDKT